MSAPASTVARVRAQARFEVRLLVSNGEQLLVSFILPALALVGLAVSTVPSLGAGRRIDLAVPGSLALCVISSAFTAQAISTAFDRRYAVLRYLGVTPLGRGGLLQAKALAVAAIVSLQTLVLGVLGTVLGWRPAAAGLLPGVVFLLVGAATFVSLALLLAGRLRAEGVLALANLIWVVMLAVGGVVIPTDQLPGALATVVGLLPSAALGDGLRAALLEGQFADIQLLILVAWGVAAAYVTSRTFRWSD